MKYPSLFTAALLTWGMTTLPAISAEEPETPPAEVVQATQQAIPGQPFTAVALYQGGFYPIIGVEKKEPRIRVEGKLISLGKDAAVYFWSNNTYKTPSINTKKYTSKIDTGVGHGQAGSGFPSGNTGAQLPAAFTRATQISGISQSQIERESRLNTERTNTIDPDPTVSLGEESDYDQTQVWEYVTSREGPLTNAYSVFIFYSDKGIAELQWRNIKHTRKDKKRPVRVPHATKKTLLEHDHLRYLLLVFQDGEERIPFDNSEREGFLRWNERASMEKMAQAYERASANQTLDPILIFRPNFILSEDSHNELQKVVVSALLNVTDTGTVSDVYLDNDLESITAYAIMETMRSWRFLPAIRDGERVEEEVEVPLQF